MGRGDQAFRAPTLNELYRQFRVQNVVTLARTQGAWPRAAVTGREIGLDYTLADARLAADVDGVLEHVEGSASPMSRWRRRFRPDSAQSGSGVPGSARSLGRTRSRGVEVELRYTPTRAWVFWASYLYNDVHCPKFPADPSLEGKRVPQVPKHMYTLGVQYLNPRLVNAAFLGRFVGDQFEDDRNENVLQSFFIANVHALATDSLAGWPPARDLLRPVKVLRLDICSGSRPSHHLVPTGFSGWRAHVSILKVISER